MPAHGLGVVVLQNASGPGAAFPEIVATYIYDLLLERDHADERARRRLEAVAEAAPARLQALTAMADSMASVAAAGHVPALTTHAYLGAYRNERLGIVRVRPGPDGLRVDWGEIVAPLVPLGGNDFLVEWQPGYPPATWSFVVDSTVTGFDWGGRAFRRVDAR